VLKFSILIPFLSLVLKSIILFIEHFAIEDVDTGSAKSIDPFIVDQLKSVLLFQVFVVVHAFGVVPDGGREHAVHGESELGQRYSRAF
jgi:hypothetical protein